MPSSKRAAFKATRLSPTTFLIKEHSDIYDEHPYIYLKIFATQATILILDTGCGGATEDGGIEITSLREFIEEVEVGDNDGKPLNTGGKMNYVVVLSHCHYDHILGVEDFAEDSPIYASGYAPGFLNREKLPKHSLCEDLNIATPKYTPTLLSHESVIPVPSIGDNALPNITLLHTPGHIPDEVALWDNAEKRLYVGDTLYEWAPIIFPNEGSIVKWLETMDLLIALIEPWDEAVVCCGHVTADGPAKDILRDCKAFMRDVLTGKEDVRDRFEKRGERYVHYVQGGMRFSLICPERLVDEAQLTTRT